MSFIFHCIINQTFWVRIFFFFFLLLSLGSCTHNRVGNVAFQTNNAVNSAAFAETVFTNLCPQRKFLMRRQRTTIHLIKSVPYWAVTSGTSHEVRERRCLLAAVRWILGVPIIKVAEAEETVCDFDTKDSASTLSMLFSYKPWPESLSNLDLSLM